jgi:hypothetical protein
MAFADLMQSPLCTRKTTSINQAGLLVASATAIGVLEGGYASLGMAQVRSGSYLPATMTQYVLPGHSVKRRIKN